MGSSQSHQASEVPPASTPFWGAITAKSNFCEEDYVVTQYIGELINTVTNVAYLIYGIYGLIKLRKSGNTDVFRTIPYWGLISVGMCSAAFHISLKYHTQMMDDLSMLFTTTPVLHRILTVNSTKENSRRLAFLLTAILFAFIVYHVITDELILHSCFFAAEIIGIGIGTFKLINSSTDENSASRREIWGIVRFGAFIFNLGFYAWLVDGWICHSLRNMRGTIGEPFAYLLELHGWWHIFTAIGAYIFIAIIDHLASGEDHEYLQETLAWPGSWASRSIFAGWSSVGRHESTIKKE